MLVLTSLVLAGPVLAGPLARVTPARPAPGNELGRAFSAAADEFGVPEPLLMAIGWEATRWNPDVVSQWGGYGMFDLREGDRDPSIEHAGALLETDPNLLMTDWRLNLRGAAAILADQGRLSNGGDLPARDDLLAWWDAVRAFSGREEPFLQDMYAGYVFEAARDGAYAETRWGEVGILPRTLDLGARIPVPPPTATDSGLAVRFYDACNDNYTDDSRGSGDIDMVVVHTVQGSYSGCYSWFANCSASASAHYVVRSSDGEVTQMVAEHDTAWHAGDWTTNLRSVGIEHEGYVTDCSYYTSAMYAGSAALTADIASRQGIPLDRSHIIAHSEVPGCPNEGGGGASCHTDPGSCWDWDYYMGLLNGETGTTGGQIIGAVADSDIYNGARLVGATVRIDETGETATVGSDGYYRFEDVPFGSYTMRATYAGYAEGTCTKATSSDPDWCSIALYPESVEEEDTAPEVDTDGEDTDVDTDDAGGGPDDELPDGRAPLPGSQVRMDEIGGCGCATGSAAPWGWGLLGGLALLARRRR